MKQFYLRRHSKKNIMDWKILITSLHQNTLRLGMMKLSSDWMINWMFTSYLTSLKNFFPSWKTNYFSFSHWNYFLLSTSKPHFFSSSFPLSLSLSARHRTPFYQILNLSWNEMSSSDSCLRSHSSPIPPRPAEIPPSKAPVGLAKPPDLKNVSSKIGSLANVKHKPGETHSPIRIFNFLLTFSSPFILNLLSFIISTSFFTLLKVNHAFFIN